MGAGRIACPRCGANNFDTVTACWKCSTPLGGVPAAVPLPQQPAPTYRPAPAAQPAQPSAERFSYTAPVAAAAISVATGNPSTANKAAIWLGLLMPYFGLPIGLAFMMCDDRRRQEVGRICVLWSIVSMVFHFLFMVVSLLGMREYLQMIFGAMAKQAGRGGMGGGLGGSGLGGGLDGGGL